MKIVFYIVVFLNIFPIWVNTQFVRFHDQSCEWLNLLTPKIINILNNGHEAIILLLNGTESLVEGKVFTQLILQKFSVIVATNIRSETEALVSRFNCELVVI